MTNENFHNSIYKLWQSMPTGADTDTFDTFCGLVDDIYYTDDTIPYIRIIWHDFQHDQEEIYNELLDLGARLQVLNYTVFSDTNRNCTVIVAIHKAEL